MNDVLQELVAAARAESRERAKARPISELKVAGEHRLAGAHPFRDFRAALSGDGLAVIAEHKRSSPSAGLIRDELSLADVVGAYQRGGAAALSVLTEPTRFSGRIEDLALAREASSLPILRKDFIAERYQVYEALAGGADAILLIVAALDHGELVGLYELARELGLAVLLEVHDGHELERGVDLGAEIIGINNRNLATLTVDVERCFSLRASIPDDRVCVAESGFKTAADAERLAGAGFDAVLVGESLMRSEDLEGACRAMASAGVAVR